MPFSSESGKSFIRNIVGRVKHDRMLDIGCGSGTYAKMFPEADWTGVEVWEPYVEEFALCNLYHPLIVADVRSVTFAPYERFDVAILGDVLEHMEKHEAQELLEKVKAVADTVIVSIPIGYYPQDEWEGNPHERHVTDNWTDEEFKATFGEPTVGYIENEIGVYCWSDKKIRPRICVYAISKNEEQFVKPWATSAADADLLLIADTGSTDNTVKECKKYGVDVHEICVTPWRFDHARNASLALIPRDIDICICLDLDEVMEPGWRQEIERVWTPQTTHLRYKFDWSSGIVFYSEKIHARHGYFWHHPCHEHIRADLRISEVWANTDFMLISHHPDPSKSRGHYLETLELSVKEDPYCPRNAFYYARELFFYARWDEAIAALEKYLKMPEAVWHVERSYAMRLIGQSHAALGAQIVAESWYQKAAAEAPLTREPWLALTKLYYEQHKWAECFGMAMRTLSVTNKELLYTTDPESWGYLPHDFAAIAAFRLGLKDVAVAHGQKALDLAPDDPRLLENMKWYRGEIV